MTHVKCKPKSIGISMRSNDYKLDFVISWIIDLTLIGPQYKWVTSVTRKCGVGGVLRESLTYNNSIVSNAFDISNNERSQHTQKVILSQKQPIFSFLKIKLNYSYLRLYINR